MIGDAHDPLGLTVPRLSRRRLLQLGGLAALGVPLAACSIPGAKQSSLGGQAWRDEIARYWADHRKAGRLDYANWTLYMDVAAKNKNDHPTLDAFTREYGIAIDYLEVIDEDDTFFGKIQPQLASGQGTGYDLMVITNGRYLDQLIQLDYLVPLDQDRMSTFYANAGDLVRDPSFDRGNVYTMAYQSGITGIGYDPKKVGHKITSWRDLQDPALRGKIGMFGDTEDMPGCALLAVGVAPETSVEKDWRKAAAWLAKQQPLVRKYYSGDYIDPLSKGDIWAAMAWSGDVFQANASGANLEFVVPDEGGMIWTDNMCIPAHAKHPVDAMLYMDYVYRPGVAAAMADSINYITPVPGAAAVFAKDAAAATSADDRSYYRGLVDSPLIFPKAADYSKLHRYRVLTTAETKVWDSIFQPIYQS